jgi:DNA-directed RNA polymerase specialized sigma24 family protein
MARTESGAIVRPTREGASANSRTHAERAAAAGPEGTGCNSYSSSVARPWELTATGLERLLLRLDPDPIRAAEAYEALRLSLTRFFDWRGAHFPDECADETLNRLARRLDEGAAVADIRTFALGIARLVRLEQARSPQLRQDQLDEQSIGPAPSPDRTPDPLLHDCLETCLAALPEDARTLILEYYQDQRREKIDRRVRLATQLGLSANALRSRAQRVRDRLERCVRSCLAGRVADTISEPAHFSRGDAAGESRRRVVALRQTDDAP